MTDRMSDEKFEKIRPINNNFTLTVFGNAKLTWLEAERAREAEKRLERELDYAQSRTGEWKEKAQKLQDENAKLENIIGQYRDGRTYDEIREHFNLQKEVKNLKSIILRMEGDEEFLTHLTAKNQGIAYNLGAGQQHDFFRGM